MDTVQRLKWDWLLPAAFYACFAVLMSVMPNTAAADDYPASVKHWSRDGVAHTIADTPEASCQAHLASTGFTYIRVDQQSTYHYFCVSQRGNEANIQATLHCPAGGTLDSGRGLCIGAPACPVGYVRNANGLCNPPGCTPGCNGVCGTEQPLTGRGPVACFNGCYHSLGDAFGIVIHNGEKTWWTDVEDNTGVPCDAPEDEQPDGAEDAPDPAETPDPCPECECARKGHSYGTVNGTAVCLKPGTPGSKPVEVAPKPTVKTDTPAPTPDNPNPEPTTTVTPSPVITITPGSGPGSQPTVTETTTNPDGSTTSTSEPQENYCQKNPSAKLCKDADKEEEKGNWGGGCGSWECEGDAANCAMSRKIHQDRCDDLEGMEQFADAAGRGQKLLHGESDEDVTSYLNREGDSSRTINVGSLVSESGAYQFAASCISDVQFSIGGHAITVPISKVCPYFEMIGYFLLAAAYLAALRIVGII